uniref:CSON007106 protein n=1 Tax=Culicoides sonorensis TaxID=179676 RepID=A0A336N5U3_CULSO
MTTSNSVFPSDLSVSDLTTIMVISEGKDRNEIGFSILDLENQPIVYLNQIVDNFWFTNVFKKIVAFQINVIIYPDTLFNKLALPKLLELVQEKYPSIPLIQQNFRSFDIKKGIESVHKLCIEEYSDKILSNSDQKPYAFASFAALLDYIHSSIGTSFATKSLKMEFLLNFGKMNIDVDTIFRLELINPTTTSLTNKNQAVSLYKIMNTCVTKMGSRCLRAMIMEPLCDLAQINDRQNVIEELIENSQVMEKLRSELIKFKDIHKLMKLSQVMQTLNATKASETMINLVLLLKNMLQDLPDLIIALQPCYSPFLKFLHLGLCNQKFQQILTKVGEVLQPEAQSAARSRSAYSRLFAVRQGVNDLLDLLRRYFSNYVDEVRNHVSEMATLTNLPLRMHHTIQKGFHIQLFLTKENRNPVIPENLEVITRSPKCITLIDAKLYELNDKISKIVSEVDIMSNGIIFELYTKIRSEIHIVYLLIDIITELDFILALAQFSKLMGSAKPQFGKHTQVIEGRHPLLENGMQWRTREIVPNSFSASTEYNFFIITGNNMAGKTVYIKMIATLQILAQLGCWVPAASATFRLCDKIMSRIGFEDNIEQGASSFTVEMREIEFILSNVTPFSLIIVDELCRSTNVQEGQLLSWCFCEKLLKYVGYIPSIEEISTGNITNPSDAGDIKISSIEAPFVYVTTHFEHLLKLTDKFMNVSNLILTDNFKATTYDPNEHHTHVQLKLAKEICFPKSVIEHAEKLLNIPGLINNDPEFMEQASRSPMTSVTDNNRTTISSILSNFTSDPKALYNIFAMVAQEARNTDEENLEERRAEFKIQLIDEIERVLASLGDSSKFFINETSNNS